MIRTMASRTRPAETALKVILLCLSRLVAFGFLWGPANVSGDVAFETTAEFSCGVSLAEAGWCRFRRLVGRDPCMIGRSRRVLG